MVDSKKLQVYFFATIMVGVLIFTVYMFSPFLTPIALALMSAVILRPIQSRIALLIKNKTIAALITVILLALVIITPLFFLGTQIFDQSTKLYSTIKAGQFNSIDKVVDALFSPIKNIFPNFDFKIDEYATKMVRWFLDNSGKLFSGTANVAFGVFIGAITLFYLLKDGESIRKALIELSPLSNRYDVGIIHRVEQAINSVIRGSVFVALIQGLFAGIGMYIFGVPNAILWGSLAAVTALIPLVGTALVLIPAVMFLAVIGSISGAIGLTIWGVIVVGAVDNLIMPALIGKGFKAHPLLILFSVLGGISFFGPVGLFLGPLVVALLLALIDVYKVLILDVAREEQAQTTDGA